MNNAINKIKTTLEARNSRITEAEDRISEVEDRMVEINESERKKEKWIKRNEDNLRDLQDNMKRSNIWKTGVPEKGKKKDHQKILVEIIVENSWNEEGNNHPSPRNPESPKQDKPKAKHPKKHISQINKDQT